MRKVANVLSPSEYVVHCRPDLRLPDAHDNNICRLDVTSSHEYVPCVNVNQSLAESVLQTDRRQVTVSRA